MNPRRRAKQWVLDGALTQDTMCKYGWVENNECKLCGGPGTEKHRLYHCMEWNRIRLQLESEVRLREQIAKGDSRCWLWDSRDRVEDGSIGCQKIRMCETETLEVTAEELLCMDP